MESIEFIDSHTAGEPTRVVIAGGPTLGSGSLGERMGVMRTEFDHFRRSVVLEPRGSQAVVGALLCEPTDASCDAAVIFFNNTGYLGMCGHGTIGLAVTLNYLGRVGLGTSRIETTVGVVTAELLSTNRVAIQNVPAFRFRNQVEVSVPGVGNLVGDIAWGGNWFYLVKESPIPLSEANIPALTQASWATLRELQKQGITGADATSIDHVEFFGPPSTTEDQSGDPHATSSPNRHGSRVTVANSRNFVMCPGGAYDRSPCGTGTSAKLACLAADGELEPGETWIQQGILRSSFEASYQTLADGRVLPTIIGEAFVTAEGRLLIDPADPFRHGIIADPNQ